MSHLTDSVVARRCFLSGSTWAPFCGLGSFVAEKIVGEAGNRKPVWPPPLTAHCAPLTHPLCEVIYGHITQHSGCGVGKGGRYGHV